MITVNEFIKFLQELPEEDKKLEIEYIDFSWVDSTDDLITDVSRSGANSSGLFSIS